MLQAQKPIRFFPLSDVKLLESPFRRAMLVDQQYLLALDPDRLLAPYLREAGIEPKAVGYGNWENTGLDGHIGGHYLSALSMMWASTQNPEIKNRLDYTINQLGQCQLKNGNGYLGGIPGSRALWEEVARGKIEAGSFSLNGRWVPLYNIHKIFAGLRDAFIFAGNTRAKQMLMDLSRWMLHTIDSLNDTQMQQLLGSEYGGLNEVFADVYHLSGDKRFLTLAIRFNHRAIAEPLAAHLDHLNGMHANTQIPKIIGFERIAQLDSQPDLAKASSFFWHNVVHHRTVAIGGNSVREHFHPVDDFSPMIEEAQGPETCNTYNMLRLSALLFARNAETQYMNYYEKALYNHILSSQHPEKGGFVYFTPMRPGHYRVYSQPHECFWCCVGTGLENHARYGEHIYAQRENQLLVNLYIPSELHWKEQQTKVRLDTRFPQSDTILLTVYPNHPRKFEVRLRIPEWVQQNKVSMWINGNPQSGFHIEDNYIVLHRKWKKNDSIRLQLPMTLSVSPMPDGSPYCAFQYGPVVLAAAMGDEHLNGLWADDSRGGHIAHGPKLPLHEMPTLVSPPDQLLTHLRKTGNLTFVLDSVVRPEKYNNLTLQPFFTLHETRYALYFRHVMPDAYKREMQQLLDTERQQAQLARRTLDVVWPGEQQPESDHAFRGEQTTTGLLENTHYRQTTGWFSYRLRNGSESSAVLQLKLHTANSPGTMEINAHHEKITCSPEKPPHHEGFYVLHLPLHALPPNETFTLTIGAADENPTPAIFEVRLLSE